MNIKSEWDSSNGITTHLHHSANKDEDEEEEEEDRLPTMKRRQFSLRERIQQWKRQRQSMAVTSEVHIHPLKEEGGVDEEENDEDVRPTEMKLIQLLCDRTAFRLPVDVAALVAAAADDHNNRDSSSSVADLLARLEQQRILALDDRKKAVISVDYGRLEALKERYLSRVPRFPQRRSLLDPVKTELLEGTQERPFFKQESINGHRDDQDDEDVEEEEEKSLVECILSLQSAKERENKRISEEIHLLLSKPTAKELSLVEQFRSAAGSHVQEFCTHGTREDCRRAKEARAKRSGGSLTTTTLSTQPCPKLHFLKIIQKHTDESLGDCSFLNTCFHMESCKYVHYKVEVRPKTATAVGGSNLAVSLTSNSHQNHSHSNHHHKAPEGSRLPPTIKEEPEEETSTAVAVEANGTAEQSLNSSSSSSAQTSAVKAEAQSSSPPETTITLAVPLAKTLASATEQPFKRVLFPPQWIKCDLRYFDMSILGKFAIIMADPPWDIHMELPYGTMSDDEMRKLNIPSLQDEGIIFLWVTGRAMELGRECLQLWGYERCDELIWVKTNQLQRIIRTGRTGHWINHGKEHCLVGVKGRPKSLNRGLDCDVIVAEVRATSHKPDEVYGIIERLSPGTRKIELFGRQHNTQPNWVTLGNQLTGLEIVDPALVEQYKRLYPEDAKKFGVL